MVSTGTIIYRLKGTDPDPEILTFGVEGEEANNLLLIKAATFTEADVILKSSLEVVTRFYSLAKIDTMPCPSFLLHTDFINSTRMFSFFLFFRKRSTFLHCTWPTAKRWLLNQSYLVEKRVLVTFYSKLQGSLFRNSLDHEDRREYSSDEPGIRVITLSRCTSCHRSTRGNCIF